MVEVHFQFCINIIDSQKLIILFTYNILDPIKNILMADEAFIKLSQHYCW